MRNDRVIFKSGKYRIVEIEDTEPSMECLKGDCFNFEAAGYTGTREKLAKEEKKFEKLVCDEGVFGYRLEKYNEYWEWEEIDSCWGFVGQYNQKNKLFNHYIVEELKGQIPDQLELGEVI